MDAAIQAFEGGVDRVIKFPVQDEELRLRITALLRRDSWSQAHLQPQVLAVGPIRLNDDTHTVTVDDQVVPLLPLEYRLLRYLMQHANQVVSKTALWREVWADLTNDTGNCVEVAIRRLRIKIEKILLTLNIYSLSMARATRCGMPEQTCSKIGYARRM